MHRSFLFFMTLLVALIGLTQSVSGQSRPELEATFALGHSEVPHPMFVELTEVKFPAIKEALEQDARLIVLFDGAFSPEKHTVVENDSTLNALGRNRANYVEDMRLGLARAENVRAMAVEFGIPVERTRVGAFIGRPTERIVRITLREEGDYATRDELAAVAQVASEANDRSKDNATWNAEQDFVLSEHASALGELGERLAHLDREMDGVARMFIELDDKPSIEWLVGFYGAMEGTSYEESFQAGLDLEVRGDLLGFFTRVNILDESIFTALSVRLGRFATLNPGLQGRIANDVAKFNLGILVRGNFPIGERFEISPFVGYNQRMSVTRPTLSQNEGSDDLTTIFNPGGETYRRGFEGGVTISMIFNR